jgi:hypothetical protein
MKMEVTISPEISNDCQRAIFLPQRRQLFRNAAVTTSAPVKLEKVFYRRTAKLHEDAGNWKVSGDRRDEVKAKSIQKTTVMDWRDALRDCVVTNCQ